MVSDWALLFIGWREIGFTISFNVSWAAFAIMFEDMLKDATVKEIALFSYRISHLTEHLKLNRKDYSTERALTTLVGKRRALLNYLKNRDIERYRAIVKALGLRK